MRTRSFVAALAVALALVPACFSGSKHEPPPPPPASQVAPPPPPPAVDYAAVLANPLAFLPTDSDVVLGLDVDSVRASSWWPLLAARVATSLGSQFNDFKRECGTDPMLTVRAVTLGFKAPATGTGTGVLVVRGLDRAKLVGCVQRLIAQAGPNNRVAMDAGFITITSPESRIVFAFVDASSAVALIGPAADRAGLEAVLASKVPLESSPAFTDLATRIDFHSTLWAVMNGSSRFFDQLASLGIRARAVVFNSSLRAGLAMEVRVRLDSPDKALALANMAQAQAGGIRALVDRFDVATDGPDVIGTVQMSDQQLTQLMAMVGLNLNP